MEHLTTEQILAFVDGAHAEAPGSEAAEHLRECAVCREKLACFELLDDDLKLMDVPDVSPGFALRVTAKVRERETAPVFNKPAFRVFRWALVLSVMLVCGTLFIYVSGDRVTLPALTFRGGVYYITSGICLALIFVLDRTLARFQR